MVFDEDTVRSKVLSFVNFTKYNCVDGALYFTFILNFAIYSVKDELCCYFMPIVYLDFIVVSLYM
jgi:hypothetical protein